MTLIKNGVRIEDIKKMTPSLTNQVYREMQAQYLEGLAHSLNVGFGYIDDKSRRRVVRKLYSAANEARRPSQGIRLKALTDAIPVVDKPLEDRSKIIVKTMDDYLKERKLKAVAEQTTSNTMPRPPGSR